MENIDIVERLLKGIFKNQERHVGIRMEGKSAKIPKAG